MDYWAHPRLKPWAIAYRPWTGLELRFGKAIHAIQEGAIDSRMVGLIHTLHDLVLHGAEGADLGHAIPFIGRAGLAAQSFVAFEEARHEELLRQRGEFDTAP